MKKALVLIILFLTAGAAFAKYKTPIIQEYNERTAKTFVKKFEACKPYELKVKEIPFNSKYFFNVAYYKIIGEKDGLCEYNMWIYHARTSVGHSSTQVCRVPQEMLKPMSKKMLEELNNPNHFGFILRQYFDNNRETRCHFKNAEK